MIIYQFSPFSLRVLRRRATHFSKPRFRENLCTMVAEPIITCRNTNQPIWAALRYTTGLCDACQQHWQDKYRAPVNQILIQNSKWWHPIWSKHTNITINRKKCNKFRRSNVVTQLRRELDCYAKRENISFAADISVSSRLPARVEAQSLQNKHSTSRGDWND